MEGDEAWEKEEKEPTREADDAVEGTLGLEDIAKVL